MKRKPLWASLPLHLSFPKLTVTYTTNFVGESFIKPDFSSPYDILAFIYSVLNFVNSAPCSWRNSVSSTNVNLRYMLILGTAEYGDVTVAEGVVNISAIGLEGYEVWVLFPGVSTGGVSCDCFERVWGEESADMEVWARVTELKVYEEGSKGYERRP